MNASFVADDLAVGAADAAEEMCRRGWGCVCVADDLPPPPLGRHFPLADGSGSDPEIVLAAVRHVARRLAEGAPTFVYCRHGRNRSACVTAAAMRVAGRCRWVGEGLAAVRAARAAVAPRDDTLAEMLAAAMRLCPPGPNHE